MEWLSQILRIKVIDDEFASTLPLLDRCRLCRRRDFLVLAGGRWARGAPMDMITESLLAEFSKEQELMSYDKDDRFEHFAAFITVRRHHSETFDTSELVIGKGDDT